MNVFTIAVNDQSIYYLGRIFGNVGTVLPGTGPQILSAMFKIFNTAILGIGALVVTYTTVVGILNTAAEGEFLGKHWHSIWVPLRTVIGIAGLFPMKTGYCAMQVLMMWVILQGVGAADSVWTAAINYFKGGGMITVPAGLSPPGNTTAAFTSIWQNLICEAAMRAYACKDSGDPACKQGSLGGRITNSCSGNSCTLKFGPNQVCGTLSWNRNDAYGQAKDQAFRAILPTIARIADFVLANQLKEKDFIAGKSTTPGVGYAFPPPVDQAGNKTFPPCDENCYWEQIIYPYAGTNFFRDAANAYQGYMTQARTQGQAAPGAGNVIGTAAMTAGYGAIGSLAGGYAVDLNKTFDIARDNGWIFAGGYFYFIATMTNKKVSDNAEQLNISVSNYNIDAVNKSDPSKVPGAGGNGDIVKLTEMAGKIAGNVQKQQEQAGGEGKMGGAAKVTSGSDIGDVFIGIFSGGLAPALVGMFMATIGDVGSQSGQTSQQNPIVILQAFGETLLIICQVLFFAVGAAIFTGTMITAWSACVNPTGYAVTNVAAYFLPALFFLFLALFTFGATLAVYVPLIPYIIFTMGAIGWIISTIEAMVAAPIVALGIMHPEGQHQIWGKAEHGVLLLLNIFLRPTLMIFGLITGMLLSYVVVTLINAAFLNVMRQIYSGPGLVEMVLFLAAYCGLVITALNKSFSLIHLLPERVLGWIGGRGEAYGEGEAAKEVGGKVSGAAEGVKGAGKPTIKAGKEQADLAQKERDKQAAADIGAGGRGRSGAIGGDEEK